MRIRIVALTFAGAVLLPLAACKETIDTDSLLSDDASMALTTPDAFVAQTADDASVQPEAPTFAVDDDSGADAGDAACTPPPDASFRAPQCRSNGQKCNVDPECCSGRCTGNYCLQSGICDKAPGQPCMRRSECCSFRCEPNPSAASLLCTPYCMGLGAMCSSTVECCSLGCHGGVCSPNLCNTVGTSCDRDGDCCSGKCIHNPDSGAQPGKCESIPGSCLPSGEACSADDAGAAACCSKSCTSAGRCDLGGSECREQGTPCNTSSDCCGNLTCVPNQQGVLACYAPCLQDGDNCSTGPDCCSGVCGGQPSLCQPNPPYCR